MKEVIAYIHIHWDREWYREFEDFRLRLIEVINKILFALENNEIPCFYFDGQTAVIEDYLEIYPEKEQLITKLVKEKKLRIGPFYCSTDSFLVSGESYYRNLENGIKVSKKFCETEFIGYLSDTFGHSRSVPYIFKSFGINKICIWRGVGDLPADIKWNGIDTTYLILGTFQGILNSQIPINLKALLLRKDIDKISEKSGEFVLLPIGADQLSIADNLTWQIDKLNKIYNDYKIKISTPFEYFDKINKRTEVNCEFLDNSKNSILPGVYSSRIYVKQANAYSQWLLTRIAEPLQALSNFHFNTISKQKEIDYAYKTLLKNHAHDSIYGCNIDKVQLETMIRYEKVNSVANGVIKRTIRDLSVEKAPLSVINLSNYDYSGHIEVITEQKLPKWMNAIKLSSKKDFTDSRIYNIDEIPITEDITNINTYLIDVKNLKPFSLTQIKKENICYDKYLKTTKSSIENNNIKIEIKNNNIILTDKKRNTIYNDFIIISDRADIGDSYNFGALKNDKIIKAKLVKFKLKKSNNIIAILSTFFEINIPMKSSVKGRTKKTFKHKLAVDFILYNQSEYLEFNVNWNNKSKNHILQIGFNLKDKIYKTLNEDLFGTIERKFNPDYDIYKDIPASRGKELKPSTSPMQRFVQTQNFALYTKGNQEYEIIKNTINLTLIRATGILSNPKNPTRGNPAGPPIETPDLQCLGNNVAKFAISFTNDENTLFKISEQFYTPYVVLFTNLENKILLKKYKNKLLYATKTENNNLIIRTFDNKKKIIEKIKIKH